MIVYKPGSEWNGRFHYAVQQVDIMPSIMDYLSIRKPFNSFGKSFFRNGGKKYAFQYNYHVFLIENDQYLLQFDGNESLGLYDYRKDALLQNDLSDLLPDVRQDLENTLKAILQLYSEALINNKLSLRRAPGGESILQ
jgi:hypothetical protein